MVILKKYAFLFCAFILFTFKANAGFMIEPYAGFALAGGLEQKQTVPLLADYSGFQLGARAGMTFLGFMGGVTYNMASSTEYEFTQGVAIVRDNATRNDLGLFIGFNFPIMLRVWGSYYLDSQLEGEDAAGTLDSTETWKGDGLGFGVGFTGLPFISINLEFKTFTFTEEEDTNAVPTTRTFSPEFTGSELFISVSLPFDL